MAPGGSEPTDSEADGQVTPLEARDTVPGDSEDGLSSWKSGEWDFDADEDQDEEPRAWGT